MSDRISNAPPRLTEPFETVNQELGFYLHAILKNVSDAVLFIGLDGRIVIFNESGQKLLKLKGEEVLLRRYWEVFSDDFFGFSMREALLFGISHKLLYQREMEISTSFVYEGPKSGHGMLLILRDISERQKLQLIANRKDRMKELGENAAAVAHEIRNPLGGIRGFASLLYRDLAGSPHLQEMAGTIVEGTKSLEKLVSAVLHFSRPIEIEPQTIELGAYLKQIGEFIKADPAFPENVRLAMHIPNAPLLAPVDPEALKGALLNLLFNALQAMPRGGVLTISLMKMEPFCQIAVTDTGVGMNGEQLKSLFSPFFTTKQMGNGVGLVETQKVVQGHLGTIDVRSQPGKGTTFTLTLPLRR